MTLPEPLIPADSDMQDVFYLPIEIMGKELERWSHLRGEDFRYACLLSYAAWQQVPTSSLPDDDLALMKLAQYTGNLRGWRKRRAKILKSWIKCSDGRLYRHDLAKEALKAWQQAQSEQR